jgi:hypothetical protein
VKTNATRGFPRISARISPIAEDRMPVKIKEWEYGYFSNTMYFCSGLSGLILTFSIPAKTKKGQIKSGKLTATRGTRTGTCGNKLARRNAIAKWPMNISYLLDHSLNY